MIYSTCMHSSQYAVYWSKTDQREAIPSKECVAVRWCVIDRKKMPDVWIKSYDSQYFYTRLDFNFMCNRRMFQQIIWKPLDLFLDSYAKMSKLHNHTWEELYEDDIYLWHWLRQTSDAFHLKSRSAMKFCRNRLRLLSSKVVLPKLQYSHPWELLHLPHSMQNHLLRSVLPAALSLLYLPDRPGQVHPPAQWSLF